MKKNVLLSICLFLCISGFSRQKFGVDLGVGAKAGLNFNKMIGTEINESYKTDPHAGFFLFLNKYRLGIQIEANWSQNHFTTGSSFYNLYKNYYNQAFDSIDNGTFRFSTISLPILVNIKLTQAVWIQFGPQFSSNVNVVDKSQILKSGVDVIKQNNFHYVGGLWLQFGGKDPLIRLNAGIRYISGTNNLNNLSTTIQNRSEWKNQMVQLHIGLTY